MTNKKLAAKLQKDIVALEELRQEEKQLAEMISALQERIVETMDVMEIKSTSVVVGEREIKATRSQSNRTKIDGELLEKKIGVKLWKKVTNLVLDTKKLEVAIASGEVDASTVASCSEVNEGKPYIRITG